jgi:hypothetical protein
MPQRARLGFLAFVLVLSVSVPAYGFNGLSTPPSGDNQAASVTQGIGPVRVTIDYSSPRVVRGKNDRKGKIWGELVPYGLSDLGANGCKTCPWRAGANENTLFTVSHDVKVQGEKLAAGKYGLFMIPGQDEWTVIFSRDTDAWGAFWYDPAHDVLRVKTKTGKSDYHEFLSYEFTEREPAKATVALKWEELQVPFTITVDNPDQLYVDMMRNELSSSVGFNWQNWQAAADFCANKKINLQEGLKWAERSVSDPNWSGGQENFATLMTLSKLQAANGKDQEAAKSFDKAINHPTATPVTIHMAARQLLTAGKKDQAVKLFQLNAKRYPNQWPVHVGLMRGYAAMGDAKKALDEAKLAVAQAPDEGNKKNLQTMIKQLEEGKTDIN